MFFLKGQKVWLEDEGGWKKGVIEGQEGQEKIRVSVRMGANEQVVKEVDRVKMRERTEESEKLRADMIEYDDFSEATLVHNLEHRYSHNLVYTSIGSILLSVNPYQPLPQLYTLPSNNSNNLNNLNKQNEEPHIYKLAENAYKALFEPSPNGGESKSQSILINGESGSGKTEATQYILSYLTHMS